MVKSPGIRLRTAVSGRIAVPAFPREKSVTSGVLNNPEFPSTSPDCQSSDISIAVPSCRNASTIRSVSSDLNRFLRRVVPSASADRSRARLDRLLDPGKVTSPVTCRIGASVNWFWFRSRFIALVYVSWAIFRFQSSQEGVYIGFYLTQGRFTGLFQKYCAR